jgi:hypothetical protein
VQKDARVTTHLISEINEWDGHGFSPLATPVCSRQWNRRQSEIIKEHFGFACQVSVII